MTKQTTYPPEAKTPTHILKMLSRERGGKGFPVKIGAIWETQQGNLRLSFDIVPDSIHLHRDVIIAVPFMRQDEVVEDEALS